MTGVFYECHSGNTGVERTQNKSQHRKNSEEEQFFELELPGFELATFRSRVRCSNQQAIPAPNNNVFFAVENEKWERAVAETMDYLLNVLPKRTYLFPTDKRDLSKTFKSRSVFLKGPVD